MPSIKHAEVINYIEYHALFFYNLLDELNESTDAHQVFNDFVYIPSWLDSDLNDPINCQVSTPTAGTVGPTAGTVGPTAD